MDEERKCHTHSTMGEGGEVREKKNTFSDSAEARHACSALLDLFMLHLSPLLADTLDWIRRGATNEQIAVIMGTSAATIRKRRERIIKKIKEHFGYLDIEHRSFADYLDEQGDYSLRMGEPIDGDIPGMQYKKRKYPRKEGEGPQGGPYRTATEAEICAVEDDYVNIRHESDLDKYFDRD